MAKQFSVSVLLKLIDDMTGPLKGIGQQMKLMGDQMMKFGKQWTTFVTLPILLAGGASVKAAADFEKQKVAFEALLGSAAKAEILLKQIEQFAATTPFQMPGLIEGSKRLLAFGTASEDVVFQMKMLGNLALGDATKLDSLVQAFGKVQARGKASMREINMFINAGVPILQLLGEELGKTNEELIDMSAAGELTFDKINAALQNIATGSGKLADLIDKQSQTFSGLFSTMKDNAELAGKAFGEVMLPMLKEVLKDLIGFFQWVRDLDETTKKWIITIGAVVAAIGPLMLIVGGVIKLIGTLKVAMISLTAAGGPLIILISLVTAAALALSAMDDEYLKLSKSMEKENKKTREQQKEVDALVKRYHELKGEAEDNESAQRELQSIMKTLAETVPDLKFEFDELSGQMSINIEKAEEYRKELSRLNKTQQLTARKALLEGTLSDLREEQEAWQDLLDDATEEAAIDHATNKLKKLQGEIDEVLKDIEIYDKKLAELDTVGKEKEGVDELTDSYDKLDEAKNKYLYTSKFLFEQMRRTGGGIIRGTQEEVQRILDRMRENRSQTDITVRVKSDDGTTAVIDDIKKKEGEANVNVFNGSQLGMGVGN